MARNPNRYRIEYKPRDYVERLLMQGSPIGSTWQVFDQGNLIAEFADADDAQLFVNAKRFLDDVKAQRRLTITDAGRMLLASTTKEPPT